ncbi:MAG: hypothetical protein K0S04_1615 [Herbinix sp.]|jgi:hypothetical protein|nr:hypothetical protein [Herbinix sp.]
MLYGNMKVKKLLRAVFMIIIFILIASSCISVQNITLSVYKSSKIKRVEEMNSFSHSINKSEESMIDPGVKNNEFSSAEILDQTTFSIILLIIKNLFTLFSKLIIILSFYQCFLYIRGWIILVSQVKLRFFVIRYLQLVDGKKSQLVFQSL